MNTFLVLDDLFLQSAYSGFLREYGPVYGDQVKVPLPLCALTRAAASYLGREIAETHVFYLPGRQSSFLRGHIAALAKALIAEQEGPPTPDSEGDLPEEYLSDYLREALGVDEAQLLARSTEAHFHACDLLAMEAAQYAAECASAVVVGDDPAYEMARPCPDLTFIRSGNQETSMPADVRWVDSSYLFCVAYGVTP